MSTTDQGSTSSAGQTFKDTANQVSQTLRDAGAQVRDAAQEKMRDVRDHANEYYEQGRDRAMEWEQGLESYVKEKPLQSLMIAAGVGVILGLLWKRR
jgi:ElaB/YqjD/DUF883 family membrane-anchored ribosome-binding protein